MYEGCLLSADKGPGPIPYLNVEAESASEDIVSEKAPFPGLAYGSLETMNGQRIFGADVYKPF